MDLAIPYKPNPLLSSSKPLVKTTFLQIPTKHRPRISRQKPVFRVYSSANSNVPGGFSWQRLARSVLVGSERFSSKLGESVKKETGFDLNEAIMKVDELVDRVKDGVKKGDDELTRFRTELLPQFVEWNRWERWQDFENWEPKRVGALVLYVFVVIVSCQRMYVAIRAPFKKGLWRKTTPKGLKLKKFIERPDGTLVHDSSYVGEDAWVDDPEPPSENVKQVIESNSRLTAEDKEKLKEDLGISAGQVQANTGTWRERLHTWKEIIEKEKLSEEVDSLNAKFVVDFDMKEVEKSLRKDMVEKVTETQGTRALWIAKRWWRYRPKLPYTYFLEKLDSSEVAAVVFTEDLKRLYVTMKEGFPLEYVVDIPLDPYLFETIASSGAEVDLLQKRQIHYFLKVLIALLPGILILSLIRETVMLLHITSSRLLYKKYNQLFDMAYAENFILPVGYVSDTKSMYKEVVLGGDVWDLLDELMIYMGNPMQYYERGVQFVRAPAFVFVDEIDAIAGRHARKDPRRRATFEALIAQLDGDKERTGVDRFSLRQAVIFICATNRPDELDLEFVRPGRIDRRLYIGLPDAKQRVQIFDVHSAGKQLAEDVNFEELVFRTVGFSGADIRNLVNESGIMSVRKGHSKIQQQDIVDVLDKQLLEGMGVLLTEEEQQKCEQSVSFEKKRLLAVHEAGHIVLAHLFPRFDWHAFSQLLPGGKETAISVFYPREDTIDQGYTTFGYLKMQMVVAHGGRCAERLVFGDDVTDGGKDDLEKITKIAREMVISPQNARLGLAGLTRRVGLLDRPDSSDGDLIKYRWDDPQVIPTDMTLELSELFTRELTRYIEETEELAMNGLRDNKHILEIIAKELLENSRITGLEVEEKLQGLSPVMFEDFVKPFQINLQEEGPLPHNDRLRYKPLDIYPAPLHRC
ncbi:hypothetical protein CUMW_067240 [Citrus unshiu]|nr:hypothetical protein CUMW_067240 [Citrus unshiu]